MVVVARVAAAEVALVGLAHRTVVDHVVGAAMGAPACAGSYRDNGNQSAYYGGLNGTGIEIQIQIQIVY